MAEYILVFCLVILLSVISSLTQTITTTVNADGSVTTTTTTTTTTQTNISTSGTTDFISVAMPTTDHSLLSAATTSFERLLAIETAKVNYLTSGIASIQSVLSDLGTNIGPGIASDYYLEGTFGTDAASTFLAGFNKYVSDILRVIYNQFPETVNSAYANCTKNFKEESKLTSYVADIVQQKAKLTAAVSNFKTASAKCAQTDLTQKCLEDAVKNSIPLPLNRFNTTALLDVTYVCLEAGANAARRLATVIYKSIREVVPENLLIVFPEQFDKENKTFPDLNLYIQPAPQLENVKALLSQANQEATEALSGKVASLASVKAFLEPVVNASLALIDRTKVDTSCIVKAKSAVATNLDASAKQIFQCIANVPSPPTTQQILDLEIALSTIEVRKNNRVLAVGCAGKLRNAFDSKKLLCCITEAQNVYETFVEEVISDAETILKKSKNIKSWLNYCAASGQTSFQNQLRNDLVELEKCAKQKTKAVIDFPIFNPYVNASATTGYSTRV